MEIKEYTDENIEQVKDLLVELQEYVVEIDNFKLNIVSPDYREEYFKKTYLNTYQNEGKMFVAVEDSVVIGMISGHVEQYTEEDKLDYLCPKKGIIDELIVSKSSRSGGVGKALIEFMENYFKSIDCRYCQVDVFAPNTRGIKFYERQNFENRMQTMFKKL